MNANEISQLLFFADAIVAVPNRAQKLLNRIIGEDLVAKIKRLMATSIIEFSGDLNLSQLTNIANKLFRESSVESKQAGRSLCWAIENRYFLTRRVKKWNRR